MERTQNGGRTEHSGKQNVGQTDVDHSCFYIPLSSDYEHEADENMASFIQYINEAARG